MYRKDVTIKRVNLSLKLTEVENDILNKIVEEENTTCFNNFNKSTVVRDLIIKEFIRKHIKAFNALGVNIENRNEVLSTVLELGIENFSE